MQPVAIPLSQLARDRTIGLSREQVYRAAKRGEIPAVRIGGRLVVSVRWLRETLGYEPPVEPPRPAA